MLFKESISCQKEEEKNYHRLFASQSRVEQGGAAGEGLSCCFGWGRVGRGPTPAKGLAPDRLWAVEQEVEKLRDLGMGNYTEVGIPPVGAPGGLLRTKAGVFSSPHFH